jgi:imidazolonepropionase-like amidohydrolase
VRREHKCGSDWIKTTNTGGYFRPGDDHARVTWFDHEMQVLCDTATQLGLPVAVHTGAAHRREQAIARGTAAWSTPTSSTTRPSPWQKTQRRSSCPPCR